MARLVACKAERFEFNFRWPGWKPAQRGAISTSTTQLWIQSMTLLESHWQEAELKPQDVENLAAAERWFLHAVAQTNSRAALQGLGQLLAGPWDHGSVWHTPQVCLPAELVFCFCSYFQIAQYFVQWMAFRHL